MRRNARVDGNQKQITEGLRRIGYSVEPTHMVGRGFPDVVVGALGKNYLFEIKDPTQPPSKRILTSDEIKWHEKWRGQVHVIQTVNDALEIIGSVSR